MKKLMTMIAAVATAFGLYAADTGTSFEGTATAGGTLADEVANINELSGGASSADWWYGATDKATIKDYNTEAPQARDGYGRTDALRGFREGGRQCPDSHGQGVRLRFAREPHGVR